MVFENGLANLLVGFFIGGMHFGTFIRGVLTLGLFIVSGTLLGEGTVVVLNGPSAAGKSSIQRQVQILFEEPYLKAGIDGFFDALVPDVHTMGVEPQGKFTQEMIRSGIQSFDEEGKPVLSLEIGPIGERAIWGMHDALAAYAKHGNNLVVDYIAYEKHWLGELTQTLRPYKVYLVGITTPLEVIEEREKNRGTSPVGHARSHYARVHVYGPEDSEVERPVLYDLEVDTTEHTPEECARLIQDYIKNHPEPKAFKVLEEQYLADLEN